MWKKAPVGWRGAAPTSSLISGAVGTAGSVAAIVSAVFAILAFSYLFQNGRPSFRVYVDGQRAPQGNA